jgi:hypothetical protein
MGTKKITISLDETTHALAEQSARRDGVSLSAWLSRAARREAVRTGAGPVPTPATVAEALADEAELAAAEADLRASG